MGVTTASYAKPVSAFRSCLPSTEAATTRTPPPGSLRTGSLAPLEIRGVGFVEEFDGVADADVEALLFRALLDPGEAAGVTGGDEAAAARFEVLGTLFPRLPRFTWGKTVGVPERHCLCHIFRLRNQTSFFVGIQIKRVDFERSSKLAPAASVVPEVVASPMGPATFSDKMCYVADISQVQSFKNGFVRPPGCVGFTRNIGPTM